MGRALSALLADPSLVEDEDKLWRIATRDKAIAPNGQIEVLTALWQKGFVLNLPSPEQRELIAFLISRQTAEDESFKATLARKIEDTDPANWIELDDLKKRFAE